MDTTPEIKNQKRNNKLLGGGIGVLILVIALFTFLNYDKQGSPEGQISLKAGDRELAVITLDSLRKLPAVEKKMTVHSSKGVEKHDYTMTSLLGIIRQVDPQLTSRYAKVVTKGIDNYTSGVSMAEVLEPDNVYLAYMDGGKPLKTKNGEDGSVQVVICRDDFGQRFTKYLVSLELQN